MNPYIFNLLNGILLCVLGLWSNSFDYKYSIYFILLGVLLIGLTYFVRNSHKILGSVAMLSTILSSVILGFLFYNSLGVNNSMSAPIGMMFTSGLATSAAFIQCAVNHSTEQEACCEQPADGTACCNKNDSKEINSKATGCC